MNENGEVGPLDHFPGDLEALPAKLRRPVVQAVDPDHSRARRQQGPSLASSAVPSTVTSCPSFDSQGDGVSFEEAGGVRASPAGSFEEVQAESVDMIMIIVPILFIEGLLMAAAGRGGAYASGAQKDLVAQVDDVGLEALPASRASFTIGTGFGELRRAPDRRSLRPRRCDVEEHPTEGRRPTSTIDRSPSPAGERQAIGTKHHSAAKTSDGRILAPPRTTVRYDDSGEKSILWAIEVSAMFDLRKLLGLLLKDGEAMSRLPAFCDQMKVAPEQLGDQDETTKQNYVVARLRRNTDDEIVDIAQRLYDRRPRRDLREAFLPFIPKKISRQVRKSIFVELEHAQKIHREYLHGGLTPEDFVKRVGGASISYYFRPTQGYVGRDILPDVQGLLGETDEVFRSFLCELVHPRVRIRRANDTAGTAFREVLVDAINKHLSLAGFKLEKSGTVGLDSVYEVIGVKGTPDEVRCLIFAAAEEKPDLVVSDLLSGDVAVSNTVKSPYFVYREPIPPEGLTWGHLIGWWAERTNASPEKPETGKQLFELLRDGLQSDAEKSLFRAYCKLYPMKNKHNPALIPQFYLRWDPLTGKAVRVAGQRYDFLLLLPHRLRVILEVDGIQHYANKRNGIWSVDPSEYVKTIADTRDLQLSGYEVHRFSTKEWDTRDEAITVLKPFLARLFERRGVATE
jgi:very-short-patch-repair endonuclease